MQKRILAFFGLAGAVAGLIVLAYFLSQDPPRIGVVEIEAPPAVVAPPPEDDLKAVQQMGNVRGKVINGLSRKPIAGATVIALRPYLQRSEDDDLPLWGELLEPPGGRVKTGADGTFLIEDLPADYWNLWVEKRGYAWTTLPRAKFSENHVVELFPECSVRGRVVYEDGEPAPDIRIEYTPQGTHSEVFGRYRLKSYYIKTDHDGRFEYRGLPPGKFTIEVYPEDHLPAPWKYEPPLRPGENRDLGERKLERGFGMKVYVKWRGTDEPVPDIEVVVRPVGDPMPRTKTGRRRYTNSNGLAAFAGLGGQALPEPIFSIAANVPGVGPVVPDEQRLFRPDETVTIWLRKDSTVKGKVKRPNGDPLEHFFVELKPIGFLTTQKRVFGKDGEFTLYSVPEGDYMLNVRYGNLVDKVVRVTAVAGEEVDAGTITLESGAEIHGTVRGSDGGAVEGLVRVHLARKVLDERLQRERWETVARAYCKKDGSYSLKGIPPGSFWLWPENTKKASRTTDEVPITVASAASVIERNLVLYGEGSLKLKFMDEVEGAVREVVRPDFVWLVEKATGKEIRWFGEGSYLRPGRYDVFVVLENEKGVPQRYKWREVRIQEGETTGPIEVALYEIRDGAAR